jgi:signal transduction histidine kinase
VRCIAISHFGALSLPVDTDNKERTVVMSDTDSVVTPLKTVFAVDGRVGRILVADDEEKNRMLLRDILEAQGHQVAFAEDGQQAIEKAFANQQDVVVLDVMMPKMNGYEVCRQLRTDARTAHLPILMVTALTDRADRLKGIQAGANDFLAKPIDAEEIRLRVKNAVLAKHLYDKVQDDYARLKELENLRDNLTHMIVHDMRSPLMSVSGAYDIIMDEQDRLSSTQKEFLIMGRHASRELIEMVTSLLDVSRMEAGQMPLNRIPCDIRSIALASVDSMTVLARKRKLTLSVTGDSVSADVDHDIILRIFSNLLGNAIKFSPANGAIGIDISSTSTDVRVTVTDQGYGIPSEYQQRIFEKFGQVKCRKENKMYSTGLGLTFCKMAVEAHGGQIGVVSRVDEGSRFWFTLPSTQISREINRR